MNILFLNLVLLLFLMAPLNAKINKTNSYNIKFKTKIPATLRKEKPYRIKNKTKYKLINWRVGQSAFIPPIEMLKALGDNAHHVKYEFSKGFAPLRKEISSFFKKEFPQIPISPKNILVTNGSTPALRMAMKSLNGKVFLPVGSYFGFEIMAQMTNKNLVWLPTKRENDFKLTSETLAVVMKKYSVSEQKILVLNSPNNPTGATYSKSEIIEIAKVCRKNNIFVIFDMIYAMSNDFQGKKFESFAEYLPERTFITFGISKVFHAAGWRLGFIAMPDLPTNIKNKSKIELKRNKFFNALFLNFIYQSGSMSNPIQRASTVAFKYSKNVKKYTVHTSKIQKAISLFLFKEFSNLGLDVIKPAGTFFLFVQFDKYKKQLSKIGIDTSDKLSRYIHKNYAITTRPSVLFGLPKTNLGLRMSIVDYNYKNALNASNLDKELLNNNSDEFVGKHIKNVVEGLNRLKLFIKKLKNI